VKIQTKITHCRQQLPYSCGAASIAMLFGADESVVRKEVGTKSSGTSAVSVSNFLNKTGITHHYVSLNQDYHDSISNLIKTSFKFPIYVCGEFKDRYFSKGRDRKRNHAILICDGMVFDPSEERAMSGESYEKVFNKSLIFNTLIIIEEERPDFLKNSLKFEANGAY
jgi:ABC-type bacteriocin/lantibiotic exporter with double-glycine peptidase domain